MVQLSWDKVSAAKEEGAMGFHDLKAFNLAFLAKQGWRFQNNTNSLFYPVLNTNTFQMVTFLRSCIGVLDLRPH